MSGMVNADRSDRIVFHSNETIRYGDPEYE